MKNLILIFIAVLLVGCESQDPQVTSDDEKSQAILSAYEGYLNNDYGWADELYSDDITVYINSVEAIDKEANVAGLASHHDLFSDISISSPGGEGGAYVQTTTYKNDLGVWSHAWFIWGGTGKVTGTNVQIPCHVAYQWNDEGTISQTWLFSDQSSLIAEVNAAQASSE